MSKTRIVPLNEDVLILQDRPETVVGKIELAGAAVRAKNTGTIVAQGPALTFGFPKEQVGIQQFVGKKCQFSGSAVTAMKVDDDVYVLVHEKDVQCLLVDVSE